MSIAWGKPRFPEQVFADAVQVPAALLPLKGRFRLPTLNFGAAFRSQPLGSGFTPQPSPPRRSYLTRPGRSQRAPRGAGTAAPGASPFILTETPAGTGGTTRGHRGWGLAAILGDTGVQGVYRRPAAQPGAAVAVTVRGPLTAEPPARHRLPSRGRPPEQKDGSCGAARSPPCSPQRRWSCWWRRRPLAAPGPLPSCPRPVPAPRPPGSGSRRSRSGGGGGGWARLPRHVTPPSREPPGPAPPARAWGGAKLRGRRGPKWRARGRGWEQGLAGGCQLPHAAQRVGPCS